MKHLSFHLFVCLSLSLPPSTPMSDSPAFVIRLNALLCDSHFLHVCHHRALKRSVTQPGLICITRAQLFPNRSSICLPTRPRLPPVCQHPWFSSSAGWRNYPPLLAVFPPPTPLTPPPHPVYTGIDRPAKNWHHSHVIILAAVCFLLLIGEVKLRERVKSCVCVDAVYHSSRALRQRP